MLDEITSGSPQITSSHVSLNLTRSTAIVIRRSTGGYQEPSLLLQEQLVTFAMKLRGENDDINIRLYTQDGMPATQEPGSALREDITNGLVGSIIVRRPDRLFRSDHALPMDLLQKQHITVVVPGKRVYDFNKEEDLRAFQVDIQDTNQYIAMHIKCMKNRRSGKRERHTPTV